jgi:hypothetical protein
LRDRRAGAGFALRFGTRFSATSGGLRRGESVMVLACPVICFLHINHAHPDC